METTNFVAINWAESHLILPLKPVWNDQFVVEFFYFSKTERFYLKASSKGHLMGSGESVLKYVKKYI